MIAKKSAARNAEPRAAPGGAPRLFLVYGSDDYSAGRRADEIVARLCPPEEQAFGLEVIQPEAGEKNADRAGAALRQVLEALQTPPLLGGAKTVYLRGAPFFNPLTEPGKFAAVKEAVNRLVEWLERGLPEGLALVVLADSVHKATAFYKLFQKHGEIHVFEEPERKEEIETDFMPRVEAIIAEKGLTVPPPVLRALLDRTGHHLRLITHELEKISVFLGERREVTLADVQQLVAPARESEFYEFADAFCTGHLGETLAILRRLFAQRVFPVPLLVHLQDRLRQCYVLSDCLARGWARLSGGERWRKLEWTLPPEGEALLAAMEKDPRKGHPYALSLMAAQAARFSPAQWGRWLHAAVDAQAAMTGGDQVDPEITLELFVLRCLGPVSGLA